MIYCVSGVVKTQSRKIFLNFKNQKRSSTSPTPPSKFKINQNQKYPIRFSRNNRLKSQSQRPRKSIILLIMLMCLSIVKIHRNRVFGLTLSNEIIYKKITLIKFT